MFKRIFFILFLFLIAPLCADETINDITAKEGSPYNYLGDFFNMLFTLAFVIVLIFVSVWVLKKVMRSRMHTLNRTNGIKILERRPLNPKASLYLVDILGKGVVVSESPAGIHVVTEFPSDVNVEELMQQLQEEKGGQDSYKTSFINKIKNLTVKNHAG